MNEYEEDKNIIRVRSDEISDLAERCHKEGKHNLAEWLYSEVKQHARNISFREFMHDNDPAVFSLPKTRSGINSKE